MSGDNKALSPEDRYVLRNLVERHARERGDNTFVLFSTGDQWSYARLRVNVRKVAASLQALGVKQDDFVLSWLPNGPHAIAVWFALNYIGAVYVPVNVSYRGRLLARLHQDGESIVLKVGNETRDHLLQADPRTFFVTDHYLGYPMVLARLDRLSASDLKKLLVRAMETKGR